MRQLLVLVLLLSAVMPAFAQQPNKDELMARRQRIIQEIKESQEELAATKKDKNATMAQLRALQTKLAARQQLIGNINDEIHNISTTIQQNNKEIGSLNENLAQLKMRYAQSLRYAYHNRNAAGTLTFLFSSADFNDAVRRLRYMKRYRDYRATQADAIMQMQGRITNKIGELSNQRTQQDMLLGAQQQQQQVLMQETTETNGVVNELRGREKDLMATIQRNQKTAAQLSRAVNEIIKREIELARKKAIEEDRQRQEEARKQEEARLAAARANANRYGTGPNSVTLSTGGRTNNVSSSGNNNAHSGSTGNAASTPATASTRSRHATRPAPATRELLLTPEAAALSANFASNQGRLPWPVEKGTIISAYGPHPYPLAPKVIENNPGITIQSTPGASVRAVFDGTVGSVFPVPGAGENVVINHGNYFTVYTHLSNVSVHRGDMVKGRQAIGTVGTDDDGTPIVNFQVWKGANTTNPSSWIAH